MKKRKKQSRLAVFLLGSIAVLIVVLTIVLAQKAIEKGGLKKVFTGGSGKTEEETIVKDAFLLGESITQELLTPNEYSRPGTKLEKVNAIVVHYVGNPGTTAEQNRNYFEGLKNGTGTSASSHYIVGLDGEIIQCVPLEEISYASNNRNKDTIAIECCHPDETGKFNDDTYKSLVNLTAALCRTYGLDPMNDIIRHYDVTGKMCPLYFVEHEDAWNEFKLDVKGAI